MRTGPDTDRWNRERFSDSARGFGSDNFQHDGERPGLLHGSRIGKKRVGFGRRAAFYFVATFLAHTLRQHPDVTHDGNALSNDRLDLCDVTRAAFQFHRLRAGFH